jgi:hypothetical protein
VNAKRSVSTRRNRRRAATGLVVTSPILHGDPGKGTRRTYDVGETAPADLTAVQVERLKRLGCLAQKDPTPAMRQSNTLDLTDDQLIAQPHLHDLVLRAICLEHDCDYLAAMTRLEEWSNDACLDNGGKPVELRRVISDYSLIALTQFNQDVLTLEGATEKILSLDLSSSSPELSCPAGAWNGAGRTRTPDFWFWR